MFYRQCSQCGERWETGIASTCKCKAQQKPEQQLMEKAYLAGFLASSDGYNGQCPFDQCGQEIESDEDWCIDRDDALRQLLEQQEQEPVAPVPDGPYSAPIKELWPVAPKPWVGLTDEEICMFSMWLDSKPDATVFTAIEAKLREKNSPHKEKNT